MCFLYIQRWIKRNQILHARDNTVSQLFKLLRCLLFHDSFDHFIIRLMINFGEIMNEIFYQK